MWERDRKQQINIKQTIKKNEAGGGDKEKLRSCLLFRSRAQGRPERATFSREQRMVRKQEVIISKEIHIPDRGKSKCRGPKTPPCLVGYRMVEKMASVAKWHERGKSVKWLLQRGSQGFYSVMGNHWSILSRE